VDGIEDELRQRPLYFAKLPLSPAQSPRLVDPSDPRADLDARVRSYLHANCAQCHVTAGGGNAQIDLEFTTPHDKTRLIGHQPLHQSFDLPDAQLVVAGKPEASLLYHRVARRGRGQMPPLATSEVDRNAVRLLREWIESLTRGESN
jgi:mono/diheme cytochrome c family protein